MTRRSGNKWRTEKCGRCEMPHSGYSGKLDAEHVEYVVCGITNKRMNVELKMPTDFAFNTIWEKEEDHA